MTRHYRRAALVAAALITLAGCSTGASGSSDSAPAGTTGDPSAFPVTIQHAYGETTIETVPTRVATVSWVNADVALALDTVPVGMASDDFGGDENGLTPWKVDALEGLDVSVDSDQAPKQYSEADGINFNAISQTDPDVILAAYSGLTQEEYNKLTEIAPVIAYPEVAYGTSWQESTQMIGQALGKSDEAAELITDVESEVADDVAEYPQITGKTYIFGNLEPAKQDGINVYQSTDNRPRFMDMLGMQPAPAVVEAEKTAEPGFSIVWSPENASQLDSDVFLTWSSGDDALNAIKADPLLSQIPAIQKDSLVAFTDDTMTLATSAASPLSIPWATDKYLPLIADAVAKASA
ncbi:ABC transporter substrate-binding protein [Epidermidibacterium keratini]|uniref:ABC transporter substrate-binding protein n=1 Tax=Epidermidibacterium keratini TaxID=1891644 RepID=A0A7L4YNC6_9ACTN|nr:iron-siderophore ABC transporter substrate-binding protein [Epidermidibacterium keratini]QHC00354.1 ABC transporter substrate-binding protein [Epidermidibacterium keratini]